MKRNRISRSFLRERGLRGRGALSVASRRRGGRRPVLWLLVAAAALASTSCASSPTSPPGAPAVDFLFVGATVVDGTGAPPRATDVAVAEGRIVGVGDLAGRRARRVVDARGLVLAPGFIDIHSHAGPGLATPESSAATPLLAQGVTTVVVNPDGGGPVDLAEQRRALLVDGLGVHVAQLVPHGSVRGAVLGAEDRNPDVAEMGRMEELVRRGMEEGAWGMSSGTFYVPGSYAEADEIVALARVAAEAGGIYTSHIRDESDYTIGVVAAVEEVVDVARRAGLPVVVTHVKALGPPVWGRSVDIVRVIEEARDEGLPVWADQYPYAASATSLGAALLPRWAQAGGRGRLLERLGDDAELVRIRAAMEENLRRRGGAARIRFRGPEAGEEFQGRTLEEAAERAGLPPLDLALALLREGDAGIVSHNMDPEDVRRLMRQPWTMTSSDGGLAPPGAGSPHPRNVGAFTRKLETYVLTEGVVSMEQAIRSMTGLPAQVLGMGSRGLVREGLAADLVLFDPEELHTAATYTDPHHLAEGMRMVLVEGRLAVDDGEATGARSGRVLLRGID